MKLYIGADFVPTDVNKDLFEAGNAKALVGETLYELLKKADLNVFNLEVPLTDAETPIDKFGNNLIAPTKTVLGYADLQPLFLTLANNHCLDQGVEGLRSTMQALEANHIPYTGIGMNRKEAEQPYIFEKEGLRVGFFTCTENEFTSAGTHSAGANPFDVLESFDDVQRLKESCDYVIVLYHGGKEFYRYPSPNLQRYARKFVEKGADLVVCQHNHCIACREEYKNRPIIYGQGNFIFHSDFFIKRHLEEFVNHSLVLDVTIDDGVMRVEEIPITKTDKGVRLSEGDEAERVLHDYRQRSEEIKSSHFVVNEYKRFADTHIQRYLREFLGRTYIVRLINALCGRRLVKLLLGKTSYLAIQNFIECEAHQELFLRGLKNINKK